MRGCRGSRCVSQCVRSLQATGACDSRLVSKTWACSSFRSYPTLGPHPSPGRPTLLNTELAEWSRSARRTQSQPHRTSRGHRAWVRDHDGGHHPGASPPTCWNPPVKEVYTITGCGGRALEPCRRCSVPASVGNAARFRQLTICGVTFEVVMPPCSYQYVQLCMGRDLRILTCRGASCPSSLRSPGGSACVPRDSRCPP